MDASITTKKKKVWYYLPYVPIFCFGMEVVSVALWDQFSRKALAGSQSSLETLGISDIRTRLVWGSGALAFTVGMAVVLALCMLALGMCRSFIAYTADRTGATRMGGRLVTWMVLCAAFICFWFLLTLWLLVMLLGQCLWMAAAWGLNMSIQVGSTSARANAEQGNNGSILHTNETAANCNLACVDLAAFDWALGNHTCFCQLGVVEQADQQMQDALSSLAGSVVGAIMLLISSMWILMASSSEFGVTRRERQLLRRIAKARMAQAVATGRENERSKLLPGKANGSGVFGGSKKSKDKNVKGGTASAGTDRATGQAGAAAGEGARAGQGNVIIDHETGEVLDVEAAPLAAKAGAGNGDASDGLRRSSSLVKITRGIGKGVSKTVYAFELLGGYLSRGRPPK